MSRSVWAERDPVSCPMEERPVPGSSSPRATGVPWHGPGRAQHRSQPRGRCPLPPPLCSPRRSPAHLGLAVLLNPAEDTRRELLEARHRDGGVKGLEQGVHDALEHVELHLIGDLVLPLAGVVLMSFHDLLVVPGTNQTHRQQHEASRAWELLGTGTRLPSCHRSAAGLGRTPGPGKVAGSRGRRRAAPRQLRPYTFMIFKAITSFLRVETSSSCFFFSLCRNWM